MNCPKRARGACEWVTRGGAAAVARGRRDGLRHDCARNLTLPQEVSRGVSARTSAGVPVSFSAAAKSVASNFPREPLDLNLG
ncbi:hypothetical protein GCM10010277_23720 [Streptomyces longisporoflavus]|nr:hypothetical protein GCM10010277_23720 [Streptomyces longisporoflavus]